METIDALGIYEEPEMELIAIKIKARDKSYTFDMDMYAGLVEIEKDTPFSNGCVRFTCKRKYGFEQFLEKLKSIIRHDSKIILEFKNAMGSCIIYTATVNCWRVVTTDNTACLSFTTPRDGILIEEHSTIEYVDYLIEDC